MSSPSLGALIISRVTLPSPSGTWPSYLYEKRDQFSQIEFYQEAFRLNPSYCEHQQDQDYYEKSHSDDKQQHLPSFQLKGFTHRELLASTRPLVSHELSDAWFPA
jgi:hypothetical protein